MLISPTSLIQNSQTQHPPLPISFHINLNPFSQSEFKKLYQCIACIASLSPSAMDSGWFEKITDPTFHRLHPEYYTAREFHIPSFPIQIRLIHSTLSIIWVSIF